MPRFGLSLFVLSTALLAGAAQADTLTPAPMDPVVTAPAGPTVADWTGAFAGLSLGAARGRIAVAEDATLPGYNDEDFAYTTALDASLGLRGGYNWQNGATVFGLMGDLGHLGVSGTQQLPSFVGDPTRIDDSIAGIEIGGFATLTGRVGQAFGNTLVYARGGLAVGQVTASYTDINPTGTTLVAGTTQSETRTGYALGLGVEHMITASTSVSLEYMILDFGTVSQVATSAGATNYGFNHRVRADRISLGVHMRF